MAEIGHNSRRSLSATADANIETGVLLLCKEFLVTAISDRRLDRTHLRVLACMVNFVNRQTAKAWPDRRTIAETLGIQPHTVSNKLLELRNWGYLIADRERVPEANNRSLMVYTFGNVDHDTIRREIEAYIDRIKGVKVPGDGDFGKVPECGDNDRKSPCGVTSKSLNTGTVPVGGDFDGAKVPEIGARKSPYSVDSNSEKESLTTTVGEGGVGGASPAAPPKPEEAKRATRLATDWRLPRSWGDWALEHFAISADDVRSEAAAFKDYWTGLGNVKHAAKKDWQATWRNWVRNSRRKYRQIKPDADVAPDLADVPQRTSKYDEEMRKLNAIVGGRG